MTSPAAEMGIGIVMLGVRDLSRSIAFYRDSLGLTVSFASEEFAFLSAGSVSVGLRQAPDLGDAPDDSFVELVFTVPDVDEAYARLRARNVAFRVAPRVVTADQLAADFRDPDGHVLSIFGPRKAGAGADTKSPQGNEP